MKSILLVEDELVISRVLKAYLQKEGHQVWQADDGIAAIRLFDEKKPDLVLLDVMLPERSGWEILQYIREKSACPVIILTALGQTDQKLKGLNQGADDYITKPFVAEEVVARVNAVLRRSAILVKDQETRFFGSLRINFQSHHVTLHGLELVFHPRDLSLLLFLAQNPNQTFTREQLIDQVWGIDFAGSDRAVDLAIKRVRKTLENWPAQEGEIKTLRGVGYQFCVY
ncbi:MULTISPECIES: response regulator transcription factor [Brevibacillus]|jgi:two-component system response regulator VicR|uniref:DNA-binding response regulator n=1 Tax=Brevibacillus parabrevis TaxID=54914 RepID=A0A4Y3PAE1_BREPA|nr:MULTISPECIES: response regulator transcription factor [Brevibacillus]MBU8712675.1 response regulator transcription factor [Brevibacillus parabrevis]MDH6348174.1 two-component system response regulator VicR [Brevibacillus sp. 1238]MDR5000299.1 response regulator transcription factor [Brevibacillus parabrevis]MED2256715.1 response regulator transcription factor [Brevibacillus parabrevis]NRQ52700.1 response regulator transcription factor [Brevibacillus sp. HD1.4A]